MNKKIMNLLLLLFVSFSFIFLSGCKTDADIVSENLSKSADQFQVMRRVVFYNGITGDYILTIEGLCSLGNYDDPGELTVTCKTGEGEDGNGQYKKHFWGLSDNVTFFAEQLESSSVDAYHYKVIFKPEAILPDIDLSISD